MKKTICLLLVVSCLFGLIGCGVKKEAQQPSKETSVESTTESTQSEEQKEEVVAKEPVTIQVVGGGLEDEAYDKAKNDNPNDEAVLMTEAVKRECPDINVDWTNWGWAEQLDQKQRAAIMSGNSPDIVHGEGFMPTYANMDVLEPLPKDITDMVSDKFLIKNEKGEPVAVSPRGTVLMLYWNKDLLAQAGLDPEMDIKSWDDWKKASDAVTAYGQGKAFGGGIPSHPHAGGALRVTSFIRQFNSDFGEGLTATINTPEMKKTMEFLRDMDKNYPKGIGNNADEGPLYKMFFEDKNLAFIINGTWTIRDALAKGINLGSAPIPVADGAQSGNVYLAFDYFGVTATSKHKEEAFAVLKAMLSPEVGAAKMKYDRLPVANKSSYNDGILDSEPLLAKAYDDIQAGDYKGLTVFHKNDTQVWNAICVNVITRTTISDDPIDEILADAQKEIDELLK